MGFPVIICSYCGEEIYDPRIIEYCDLPEEEAKAMDAVIPNYQKVWNKIDKVCTIAGFVSMVALFIIMGMDNFDLEFTIGYILIPIMMISIFIVPIARNVKGTAGAFLYEKKASKNRMENVRNVAKLKKYKDEYKAPEVNLAMDMSTLDFIKKADELMSAEEQAGGRS